MTDETPWYENPALGLSALGLGYSALRGNRVYPGQKALQSQAGNMAATGAQLMHGYDTGTLPASAQALLSQAQKGAQASVRANYADKGLAGSSMEAQDLAAVGQRTQAQAFQLLQSMFTQGLQATQLSSGMYYALMQANAAQDAEFGKAIAGFASALGGMSGNG